jgi:hypothetical protein
MFLALSRQRLGQGEQARSTLARLRQAVQQPNRAKDEEARAFPREVEALIEGNGA